MNAGFSSLSALKSQILAEALRVTTKYDDKLTAIGVGVAAQFDRYCNRKFQRAEGALFTCSADRDHVFLDRYPVEDVTKIELKQDETEGWIEQTTLVIQRDDASGLLHWGGELGLHTARVRVTFTGGYWWDITEENNDTLPAGATALPDDLKLAWLLQCRLVWQSIDKLGKDIITTGGTPQTVAGSLAGVPINEQVREILTTYRRLQLT